MWIAPRVGIALEMDCVQVYIYILCGLIDKGPWGLNDKDPVHEETLLVFQLFV